MKAYIKNDIHEAIQFNKTISGKIEDICAPLEKHFGIRLIAFRRFYFQGGLLYLFNHQEWMNFSFETESWNSASFQHRIKYLTNKNTLYYLWPERPSLEDVVYSALFDHNLWNGMIVYRKYVDCLETYAFASSKENTAARNIYILEKDIIEHFIAYFKDKVYPIFQPVEKRILIPCQLILPEQTENFIKKEIFFKDIAVKNFYLRAKGLDIKLTKREHDCLALLSNGKKTKEIAKVLSLSNRTVESYLNKIMHKTNYGCKSQLIALYQENTQNS